MRSGAILAIVFGPIPGTFSRSASDRNGPCAARHSMIARAFVGPMPGSLSSEEASPVFTSIGPAGAAAFLSARGAGLSSLPGSALSSAPSGARPESAGAHSAGAASDARRAGSLPAPSIRDRTPAHRTAPPRRKSAETAAIRRFSSAVMKSLPAARKGPPPPMPHTTDRPNARILNGSERRNRMIQNVLTGFVPAWRETV